MKKIALFILCMATLCACTKENTQQESKALAMTLPSNFDKTWTYKVPKDKISREEMRTLVHPVLFDFDYTISKKYADGKQDWKAFHQEIITFEAEKVNHPKTKMIFRQEAAQKILRWYLLKMSPSQESRESVAFYTNWLIENHSDDTELIFYCLKSLGASPTEKSYKAYAETTLESYQRTLSQQKVNSIAENDDELPKSLIDAVTEREKQLRESRSRGQKQLEQWMTAG